MPASGTTQSTTSPNTEVNKILRSPEMQAKLIGMGAILMGGTAQEFAKFSTSEVQRYGAIVRDSGAPKE